MAVTGTIMFQNDDPNLAVGVARAWKVGFGFVAKGTVVSVYVVAPDGATTTHATEIPKLGNGKADTNAIAAYLSSFGVVVAQAVKNVIGA